ncbi:predicted protein [Botrytis cinerea T4]|uniref:Uncharacterized protein n=1 Tax=Botryotinia fuckeliana (strain T4) TaxID=999810 RepID=G2YWW1_BOTF4|nr:predicted protein [Botrytis cinerea T4]
MQRWLDDSPHLRIFKLKVKTLRVQGERMIDTMLSGEDAQCLSDGLSNGVGCDKSGTGFRLELQTCRSPNNSFPVPNVFLLGSNHEYKYLGNE